MTVVVLAPPFEGGIGLSILRFGRSPLVDQRSEDAELIFRMRDGEDSALGLLYDRYGSLAFSLAYRMLSDRQHAEDVVQDVFLSIWRNASRYDPGRSSFHSWFVTIVRNRCFDKLRGRSTQPQVSPEVEISDRPGAQDVVKEVTQTLTAEQVRSALDTLPPEQRQTIELAYFGGLSQSEISQRMDVPLGTVKGRVRMAMQKLRELLWSLESEVHA